MKEWMEHLTDEQKTKLRALGEKVSAEQLTEFCRAEKLDLPDDLLEAVDGGIIINGFTNLTHVF